MQLAECARGGGAHCAVFFLFLFSDCKRPEIMMTIASTRASGASGKAAENEKVKALSGIVFRKLTQPLLDRDNAKGLLFVGIYDFVERKRAPPRKRRPKPLQFFFSFFFRRAIKAYCFEILSSREWNELVRLYVGLRHAQFWTSTCTLLDSSESLIQPYSEVNCRCLIILIHMSRGRLLFDISKYRYEFQKW